MKEHYNEYLKCMVYINQQLPNMENLRPELTKLNSPLVLKSTLIPGHIRLDTSGITQLLMTQEKINDFKIQYSLTHNVTPNIKSKKDMLSTYSKIFGKNGSDLEEANYATEYWKYLCKFNKTITEDLYCLRKDGTEWVFDNSVLTDGYSITFQIIQKQHFKKKSFCPKKEKGESKKKKVEEFTPIEDVLNMKNKKNIGGDPGKEDILFLTDGVRTVRYTKRQRNQDTHKKMRMSRTLKLRKKHILSNGVSVEDYETKHMTETNKKSCDYDTFVKYWKSRQLISRDTGNMYKQAWFRQVKFFVHQKNKSSEDKFMNRVLETFLAPLRKTKIPKWVESTPGMLENAKLGEGSVLVIGYGNWGRTPNLKNNQPTPGIGIRRRIQKKISTVTTCEQYTSQTCPCCQTRTLEHPSVGRAGIEKHHLLRCTNEGCSKWWNRNVVGSLNILRNFVTKYGLLKSVNTPLQG